LSVEEVKKLFESAANLKHRVLLKTTYSAGLRVSEVVSYTVLSRHLLDELRIYWQKYRPGKWIFPGYNKEKHIGYSGASSAYDIAKKKPA